MKAFKNKYLFKRAVSKNGCTKISNASTNTIKIRPLTEDDRQKLRISSYQYLLP